ncbi:MAG: vitamin B12-dependent ribonucleotide reductase [Oligoflexia bacterium]|nr:vitamin B12-dependent ribonucleotide reductase [Oligoflexia bacterium]
MDARLENFGNKKKKKITVEGNKKKNPTATPIDGLEISRKFTKKGLNPLEEIEWEKRGSKISNPDGSTVFETKDAEIPKNWSQLASDIVISKYFRKAGVPGSGCETSVRQVVYRIARTIREHGEKEGYFSTQEAADNFEAELSYLLVTQRGAFNSPVWFNVGLYHRYGILGSGGNFYFDEKTQQIESTSDSYSRPQSSACFIQSVNDDLMSIFDLSKNEARIFKYGSGTGTNFSKIRGPMEKLAGGGTSSGLMSFLEVLDRGAGATKSGGTTRRAAKMVSLDIDHPEIEEFIDWKAKEERKVAALVAAGYSSDFNGEAYKTVSGQNSNNSVRLSDEFMKAVIDNKEWSTKLRTTGETYKTYTAKDLFKKISSAAWACADPGVQFDTTINEWHTCSNTDKIHGSNPCSEYMFLDDSACNLASINLLKFLEPNGAFDVEKYKHACRVFFIAQEILVNLSSYPTAKIAENSYRYRPLGLGYANLGTLLMVQGISYDSDEGRSWCSALTAIMHGEAFATSAEMAKVKGPFAGYTENKEPMLKVMKKHREAADAIPHSCPEYLLKGAKECLERALTEGKKYGYRNAQATVLAPTGTIGLLMDCDTTGIEPDFALVKFKKLAGGGYFKIVNQSVPLALKHLGYSKEDTKKIIEHIVGTMSLHTPDSPIQWDRLLEKGFSKEDLSRIEASLPSIFEFSSAFNRYNISESTLKKLKIEKTAFDDASFSLLKSIGFSKKEIELANEMICGQMTIEGCSLLKTEHLSVFDCANKNGKNGIRFLSPMSHIRMMAAAQPFLSGAISKTVNIPNESTIEDIEDIYREGWRLGLKAIAIYRDGSKISQPLSSSTKEKQEAKNIESLESEELSTILEKALKRADELNLTTPPKRRPLPKKRNGFTVEAKIGGQKIYIRTGEYEDGSLGEIFIDMHKEGAAFRSLLNCLAIAVSKGLQYGVPLEEFVNTFTFTRFEPNGMVEHENIKTATSVVDFVFRLLGMEYLGRTDFVHVKPTKIERGPQPTLPGLEISSTEAKEIKFFKEENSTQNTDGANQLFSNLMGDSPACSSCGHTTVRNGSCYRCLNCGNSMGCS